MATRKYTKKQLQDGFEPPPPALAPIDEKLGALEQLVGSWSGKGSTLLAVPSKKGLFRGLAHPHTTETISFTPIVPAPDRGGFRQPDISISGVRYHHRASDDITSEPLHEEVGFWLNIPATVEPKAPAGIIRELSIPHGNTAILYGKPKSKRGGYKFPPLPTIPIPEENFPDPEMATHDRTDQNQILNEVHDQYNFHKCTILHVESRDTNDIANIPFLEKQAMAISMTATFVIFTASRKTGGDPFLMLQYSQLIRLRFPAIKDGPAIDWPHTTVGTLFKTS